MSLLPALRGDDRGPLREALVHHSINGSFAIRQGDWKLALCADSGGWSAPRPGTKEAEGLPPVQLYNLADDPAERRNIQDQHPEIVARLTALLEKYVADGRSTPGRRGRTTSRWSSASRSGRRGRSEKDRKDKTLVHGSLPLGPPAARPDPRRGRPGPVSRANLLPDPRAVGPDAPARLGRRDLLRDRRRPSPSGSPSGRRRATSRT